MRVMIGTPTAGIVHAGYCMSLSKMMLYFLQTPIFGMEQEPREIQMQMIVGANIGQARDVIVQTALENDCTHVLFIDDDVSFSHDCLTIAAMRQMPIIVGNYRRKIPPGQFTARNVDNTACVETKADSESLEQCSFGGFGFCLIERKVFEAVPMPRFLMKYFPEEKTYSTEDIVFFQAASEAGFPAFVDHEISRKLVHNGTFGYSWNIEMPKEWGSTEPARG